MPILEKGIRFVIKEEYQMNNDFVNITFIDAETGVHYESCNHLNDEVVDA